MVNVLSKVGRLQKVIFWSLVFALLSTLSLAVIPASRAWAFDGDYAIQVTLSNPRNDVTITATRQDTSVSPVTVPFSGSGTTYKTGTILRTNPDICNPNHKSCTWTISVKDKSGTEIGNAPATFITNKTGVDEIGTPKIKIDVPGSSVKDAGVQGTASFKDIRRNNTVKPAPTSVTITLTQTSGGTNTYPTHPYDQNGHFVIHNMVPGTYTLTMTGGYQNPDDPADAVSINYKKDGIVVKYPGLTTVDFTDDPAADANTAATSCTNKDSNGNCTPSTDTVNCGAGSFNWLLCPVIQTTATAGQVLDNFIMNTLDIDVKYIFDGTNQKGTAPYGYYTAWNSFRVIATALLVIAGLIMVTSQALGFEILDAYTIRKTLPRLMIAIIGISLSWPLMRFAVQLFDTIGFDVRGLIYGPFQGFNAHYSLSASILSTLAATAYILVVGPASLTIILSVLITIFIGFLALVIRQIAIILLVIIAPIAIACYVLPNTQRAWKLWHENFFGLLLAFPLISGAIAAGHVFAIVALSTGTTNSGSITADASGLISHFTMHGFTQTLADTANNVNSLLAQGTALIADNGPKAMVGWLMQRSVGAISTLAGGAGGLFGLNKASAWLSKRRGAAAADRFHKMQNQSLWDNNNKFGAFMNKAASWTTDPLNNLAYHAPNTLGLRKRGAKVASHIEHAKMKQTRDLAETLNNVAGNNDKAYRATNGALHDGFSQQTKARLAQAGLLGKNLATLKDYDEMTRILGQSDEQTERLAANALHGFRGSAATMYQDPESMRANLAGASMMGLASHGFLNPHDLSAATNATMGGRAEFVKDPETGNYKLGQVTGMDTSQKSFAQAVGSQAQVIASRSRPDIGAGYALDWDPSKQEFTSALAEVHKTPDGKEVTRNDSIRALDVVTRMNSDSLGGAKAGIYKTGDLGVGDAITYLVEAPSADDAVAKAAQAQVDSWNDARIPEDKRNELKRRSKQQGTAEYQALKVATAAKKREEFVKTLEQIISPYSRADTENRTELIALLSKSEKGQEILNKVRGSKGPSTDREAVEARLRAAAEEAERGGGPSLGPPPPMGGGSMGGSGL